MRLDIFRTSLGSSVESLPYPPPQPNEKESVVLEKLRGFTLEIMSDELQNPSDYEYREGNLPKSIKNKKEWDAHDRQRNQRNADFVGNLVDFVPVRFGIFLYPIVPGSSTHHEFE